MSVTRDMVDDIEEHLAAILREIAHLAGIARSDVKQPSESEAPIMVLLAIVSDLSALISEVGDHVEEEGEPYNPTARRARAEQAERDMGLSTGAAKAVPQ